MRVGQQAWLGWEGRLATAQPESRCLDRVFPLRGTGAQLSEAASAGFPSPPPNWTGKGQTARTLLQAVWTD